MGTSALPYGGWITVSLTAKDDIDNVGAGRAAKGETLGLTQSCSLRSVTANAYLSRSLISSLKSVINAFLNGQLVLLQKEKHPSWVLLFLEDRVITDESRGWSREWERALCPTGVG